MVLSGRLIVHAPVGNADDGTVSLQQLWHHRRAPGACWGWSIPGGSAAQPLLRAQLRVELLSPPGATAAAHRTMRAELIDHFKPCTTEIYLHI